MKGKIASGGAVTSAMAYTFCWQLPLVLAGFGLGSSTFGIWLFRYRWFFLGATIVLLGFAHWRNWRNRERNGSWSKWILNGTTVLSIGLIVYSVVS